MAVQVKNGNSMTDDQRVSVDTRPRWRQKSLEAHVYSLLSTQWCGNDMAPLSNETFYRGERVAAIREDGFSVCVGTNDEWIYCFNRDEFQAMALWYLRIWALKDWFGLRRWLWFKLLHRRCERYNQMGKK